MKKILFTFIGFTILTSCSVQKDDASEAYIPEPDAFTMAQDFRVIPPIEFKNLSETGEYTIIDLRTPEELLPENGGKIFEEAINIDFYSFDFEKEIDALDRKGKYLIYCRSGNRSAHSVEIFFRKKGFEQVIDLEGGKVAWDKEFGS